MKEFVEKLISRLEEWSFETEIVIPGSDGYDDTANRKIICTKNTIEIVKELAEEYKGNLSENLTSWIPCSERLPSEKDGKVLICDEEGEVTTGKYSEYSNRWYIGDMCGVGGAEIIAWQPLPEPYKKEGIE